MQVSDLNNITVQNGLGLDGAAWLDPTEKPFRLYGILPPETFRNHPEKYPEYNKIWDDFKAMLGCEMYREIVSRFDGLPAEIVSRPLMRCSSPAYARPAYRP